MASTGTDVKRPAVDTEDIFARARHSQAPRLEVSTDVASDADNAVDANAGTVPPGAGIGIDLIRDIAIFMSPGAALFNLCAAVGPADASRIRTEYLRDNDNYIVHSLRKIRNLNLENQKVFCENLHLFNKCRNNILAWMEVNTRWHEKCTRENIEKYNQSPLLVEADLVFNNPAVAIEIGLLNVFQFLVEERGIDYNARTWEGFNSSCQKSLFICAVLRRFEETWTCFSICLLSCDGLNMFPLQYSVVMDIRYIPKDCLRLIMQHPDFNISHTLALFHVSSSW